MTKYFSWWLNIILQYFVWKYVDQIYNRCFNCLNHQEFVKVLFQKNETFQEIVWPLLKWWLPTSATRQRLEVKEKLKNCYANFMFRRVSIGCHWVSIGYPCLSIGCHWVSIGCHWVSIGCHWMFILCHWVSIGCH